MDVDLDIAGLKPYEIAKIKDALGPGALGIVKKNPYALSRVLPLTTVDRIAARLKVPKVGNVERGIALAEYELDRAALDGHCYLPAHTVLTKARSECKLGSGFTEATLISRGTIAVEGRNAMLTTLREAECFIADVVRDLRDQNVATPPEELHELLATCELTDGVKLDSDQIAAVELLAFSRIGVITGRPGTGKTTCTRTALDYLDTQHISYALCAPTGKAARRFSEVTGRPAMTIHRLLGWRPDPTNPRNWAFTHNENNPLPVRVIVVDESSMIDVRLAADLLAAVDTTNTSIIFVGDADQLPPVGPGAFFGDLIESQQVLVVRLQTLHRSAAGSWIYRNAPKILEGRDVELDAEVDDYDWHEMPSDDHGIGEVAVRVIKQLLASGATWDDFQLLTPMKIRAGGTLELNPIIRQLIEKKGLTATIGGYEDEVQVCRNDRVIQTKNDYKLDIFNGECGQVAMVESGGQLRVRFDKEYKSLRGAAARNLALAYALTIHRSQGSEWPIVIVVCHSVHDRMLNRRLFYTAVTRAKKKVILIGDELGVKRAIGSTRDLSRRTQLTKRLRGEL